MFGDRFTREYGDEPNPEWTHAVSSLSDAEIRNGLSRLAAAGREWPPNLSVFVAECKKAEPPREIRSDPKLLENHSTSKLAMIAQYRVALAHPEHRGSIACPYSLPGRPARMPMLDYLKSFAPQDQRDYCRAGIEWTRKHPSYALPGFKRLIDSVPRP